MKVIERYAQLNFGIDLFPAQVEMISNWINGTYKIFPQQSGKSTARKIYLAWLQHALEEE